MCLAFVELALLAVVVIQSAVGREGIFFSQSDRLPAVMALAALVAFDVVCAIYTARQLRIWRENVDVRLDEPFHGRAAERHAAKPAAEQTF